MKNSLLCLSFAVLLGTGCATTKFDSIASQAAVRSLGCPTEKMTALTSYAFRGEGCGQVTYWRCEYRKALPGHSQCCRRVETESAATVTFAPALDSVGPYAETRICG